MKVCESEIVGTQQFKRVETDFKAILLAREGNHSGL